MGSEMCIRDSYSTSLTRSTVSRHRTRCSRRVPGKRHRAPYRYIVCTPFEPMRYGTGMFDKLGAGAYVLRNIHTV